MTINSSALNKVTHISVYNLTGDLAYNVSLAFSPNNKYIATVLDVFLKALISRPTSVRQTLTKKVTFFISVPITLPRPMPLANSNEPHLFWSYPLPTRDPKLILPAVQCLSRI